MNSVFGTDGIDQTGLQGSKRSALPATICFRVVGTGNRIGPHQRNRASEAQFLHAHRRNRTGRLAKACNDPKWTATLASGQHAAANSINGQMRSLPTRKWRGFVRPNRCHHAGALRRHRHLCQHRLVVGAGSPDHVCTETFCPVRDRRPRSTIPTREGEAGAALATRVADRVRRAKDILLPRQRRCASVRRLLSQRVSSHRMSLIFHRDHPGITLVLSGASHNVALGRGEAEIAVCLSRPKDPELMIRRIGVMQFALYATPQYAVTPPADWRFSRYDPALDHLTQQVWLRTLLAGRPIVFQASDLFGQREAARAASSGAAALHGGRRYRA